MSNGKRLWIYWGDYLKKRLKEIFESQPKACAVCGSPEVHLHHVFGGTGNRKISEEYHFKTWLCAWHHNMSNEGVHQNRRLDEYYKRMWQYRYEQILLEDGHDRDQARESFLKLIGRSYL